MLASCSPAPRPEPPLLVFAAASLSDVLQEAADPCSRRTGLSVEFAFAGSGDLVRQVLSGAPADAVITASGELMERLEAGGRVRREASVEVARNVLVVVVPRDNPAGVRAPADLARARRIALGDPETVPAGQHAAAWLAAQGLREQVADALVPALDVRAALAAVASGSAQAGFVYATDARTSDEVIVAFEARGAQGSPIAYVGAPVVHGREAQAAAYLTWLRGEEAQAVFRRHGFLAPGAT